MSENREKINSITETIIGCAYKVSNTLGSGFLEKVYENALAHEMKKQGLQVRQQHGIDVIYDNIIIGEYFADLFVENKVIVELKTVKGIDNIHIAQCINYLKATSLSICLLLNFGKQKVEVKRIIND